MNFSANKSTLPKRSDFRLPGHLHGRRDGFALLVVIWGLGAIAMLVTSFMAEGRLRLQYAFNIAGATQASFIADSVINLSAMKLLSSRDQLSTQAQSEAYDGSPKFCTLDGAAVALAIEDEAGKVDLNSAPPELLNLLLLGIGLDEPSSADLVRSIVAFRSSEVGGGIALDTNSNKPVPPKKSNFDSIYELDQVGSVDKRAFQLLLPLVTVHSRGLGVDPKASPPALYAALSGRSVAEVLALEAEPYPNTIKRALAPFPKSISMEASGQTAYLIHVEVLLEAGQTAAKAVIFSPLPAYGGRSFSFPETRIGEARYVRQLRAIMATTRSSLPTC